MGICLIEQEFRIESEVWTEDPCVQGGAHSRGAKRPRTIQGRKVHDFHCDHGRGLHFPQSPRKDTGILCGMA